MGLKCPECQFDNLDDSRFCSKCATPLPSSEDISASPTKTIETPKEELTRGTTFANRYELIEELGKGGMGKVYKVFDTKIREEVALKLLKPEISGDEKTIERFTNELKFSRKIVHKNVCRMYDLNEEEGTHYITMEYVPGEDLKSFIRRSGQLTIGKSISIARQICEGLSEAHSAGVVHRDLKPGNIMIDKEGNARIMDFGIARSLKAEGITGEGVIIGTPEYMSPEQVEGKEADHRSDIYSLGVILYEMMTGKVPFEGDTSLSIALKHKSEIPKDPREVNALIPDGLCHVILRCLEKDKERRFQSIEEMLSELSKIEKSIPLTKRIQPKKKRKTKKVVGIRWKKAILRGVLIGSILSLPLVIFLTLFFKSEFELFLPQKTINSIAVLPLKNLSGDSKWEYFADGMTEVLIDELTKTGVLKHVSPSTSVMQYKMAPKRVKDIARDLDVEAVIESSMMLTGKRVQIKVKLIEAKNEQLLWDKSYERDMGDELALQSELARVIAQEIITKIAKQELRYSVNAHPVKPKALELYRKGLYFWDRRPEGLSKAWRYFDHAIREDPNCALAYAGLADYQIALCYFSTSLEGGLLLHSRGEWAKEYALKAVEISPILLEVRSSLALIRMVYDWDWENAELLFKNAVPTYPSYTTAHYWYAHFLMYVARFDEAIKEMKKALELDPHSPVINCDLGRVFYYARQFDQAIESFQRTIEIDPDFLRVHHYLGMVYLQKSLHKKALEEFQIERKVSGRIWVPYLESWIRITYAKMGNKVKAREKLDELMERSEDFYSTAILCFSLGDIDEGFDLLEKAFKLKFIRICLLKVDPAFDSVRSDPRFKELLKKIGLE